MTRDEWSFEYTAKALSEAAGGKKSHHEERLAWWQNKQASVIEEVKANGLEVSESIAMEYSSSSFQNSLSGARGAQLVVKNDYQTKLNECHQKIQAHGARIKEYDGWLQMLGANPEQRVKLDIDDYLFFFGK